MMLTTLLLMTTIGTEPKLELVVEPKDAVEGRIPNGAVVLDVRSAAKFETGHIPGAANASTRDWSKAVTDGTADGAFWSKAFAQANLDPDWPLIVCGDDMREVCRAWWLLRYAGVKDVRVFNGKVASYKDAGGQLSLKPTPRPEVKTKEWKPQPQVQSHKDDVLKRTGGKGLVIDGRSKDEFAAGRVPGAKHLEWSELLEASGCFKSREAMAKLFEAKGIDPSESPMCYCASGGRASVVTFAVEYVSGKPAANYYRSWSEWGQDPTTPKEK